MTIEEAAAVLPEWTGVRNRWRAWSRFMRREVAFSHAASSVHTQCHCARVILYALAIAQRLALPRSELDVLGAAGTFHDSRRRDDWLDVGHGARAARYYRKRCTDRPLVANDMPLAYDERVFRIMAYHDRDDVYGERALSDPALADGVLLYRVFKDADALDRWRLGEDGLDPRFLRTEPARQLVGFARDLVASTQRP